MKKMPVKSEPWKCVRFGVFEANFSTYELRKHGVRIRLRGQPLALLQLLIEMHGEIVTREEMKKRLWPADTFVDFENSLNAAIKKLRAALGDSHENSRYVETIPRVGYRFMAPVEDVTSEARPRVDLPVANGRADIATAAPKASRWRWVVLLGTVTVLVAAAGIYFPWFRFQARQQPTRGRFMLAVLPFENLTGDAGQEYFTDGLTEEMIAQLGHLNPEHLGVIARTSVMHYKNSQQQLEQIGRELGVQYVLEGSVRRDANKVRITAELIQMKDQTHLWSRQYDRELSSLLALQGEIAQEIGSEIQLTLGDHKASAPATQPSLSTQEYEAYDLYLKGLYFWNKRSAPGLEQAIGYFQQATAKDPNYAPAFAGLANCYALIGGYSARPQIEYMRKARAAALRALEIDEKLAEAHTALALIVQNYDWDWQTSEKEYRRAIELNPNYATSHHWYAEHLMWLGRFDEALRESERARQRDPLSLIIATDNGAILYSSRQYDRAIEKFRAVLEMDPNFQRASIVLYSYVEKGMFADALTLVGKDRHSYGEPWYWLSLAYVYGRSGQQGQARRALEEFEHVNRGQMVDPAVPVSAYAAVGDKDKAFAYLEKAYSEHSNIMTTLKVEPAFDSLRGDPRFQDLLRRVGLAPSTNTEGRTSAP